MMRRAPWDDRELGIEIILLTEFCLDRRTRVGTVLQLFTVGGLIDEDDTLQ